MTLDERHLVQLAAVIDIGCVSERAALSGLPQPAVSRSLSMLEARVGRPLFVRSRRPQQPTPLAEALAVQVRAILAASRKASGAVQGYQRGTKGIVHIGGAPCFMDAMISRMIAAFQSEEPDVTVQQSYGNLPDVQAALEAGEVDLAVVPTVGGEASRGFEFIEILPGRTIRARRPGHPLLRRRRLRAADLAEFPGSRRSPARPSLPTCARSSSPFGCRTSTSATRAAR